MGFRITDKPFNGCGCGAVYPDISAKQEASRPQGDEQGAAGAANAQAAYQRLLARRNAQEAYQRLLARQRASQLGAELDEFISAFDDMADPTETELTESGWARLFNKLTAAIHDVTSFIEGFADEQNEAIAIVRSDAEELRTRMRRRLIIMMEQVIRTKEDVGFLENQYQYLGGLPLTDDQRNELRRYLDQRIIFLETAPPESGELTLFFINEDEGIADIESEWVNLNELGSQIMAGLLQAYTGCEETGEADFSAYNEARSNAEWAVEQARTAAGLVSGETLEARGVIVPAYENIIELPGGVRVCGEEEAEPTVTSTTFVYLGEFDEVPRPTGMGDFHDSVIKATANAFEGLLKTLAEGGYHLVGSFRVDFQLYIDEEGRIRTVTVNYNRVTEDVEMYQDFANQLAFNISKEVSAPAPMRYYHITLDFVAINAEQFGVAVVQ